eukprot:1149529-Pelagomonas_calceolata.AAC.6
MPSEERGLSPWRVHLNILTFENENHTFAALRPPQLQACAHPLQIEKFTAYTTPCMHRSICAGAVPHSHQLLTHAP